MDNHVEEVVTALLWTLQPTLSEMSRNLYLKQNNANTTTYVDVSVDDFLGLAHGTIHGWSHVCRIFFHALDKVFLPL